MGTTSRPYWTTTTAIKNIRGATCIYDTVFLLLLQMTLMKLGAGFSTLVCWDSVDVIARERDRTGCHANSEAVSA